MTGTINGFPVVGDPASDVLEVTTPPSITFSKSFNNPAPVGGTETLTFTITNNGPNTESNLSFSDNLDDVVTGLVAIGLPVADVCGTGSTLTGTDFLTMTGVAALSSAAVRTNRSIASETVFRARSSNNQARDFGNPASCLQGE